MCVDWTEPGLHDLGNGHATLTRNVGVATRSSGRPHPYATVMTVGAWSRGYRTSSRWTMLAGSVSQRRLQLLSVDLVSLRMESGRQHPALGIVEYRFGASPMFVTELEAEAVELPDDLGPDPYPELERVRVVR